jgi:hypothetical protein
MSPDTCKLDCVLMPLEDTQSYIKHKLFIRNIVWGYQLEYIYKL